MLKTVSVSNLQSPRSGRDVSNQFEIRTPEGVYFQSYRSLIAFIPANGGKTVLDAEHWDYSRTTSKYRCQFLGETTKETQAKIKDGTYVLADLNPNRL